MDSERWKRINTIFHDALDLPPGDRQKFVSAATIGDEQLLSEVEALLRADEGAGSYLESPLLAQDSEAVEALILQEGFLLCSRFRITRKIAEGGMGQVYEASDTELGTQVALKVIRPEIASDPAILARFRQEVKLARRITHPNVCRTYDFESDVIVDTAQSTQRVVYFLTMEFLPGETLAARVRRVGALPTEEALAIARQIADAIDSAHSLGIIHRDLKPGNLMITSNFSGSLNNEPRAVVTDFGLARVASLGSDDEAQSISKLHGWPIGTLAYMSPEQLQSSRVSSATDLYSFGLILFEMITGRRAFPAESFLEGITERVAGLSPEMEPKTVPQSWRDAIHWCIRADPTERPSSAAAVIEILAGIRKRPTVRQRSRRIWIKSALLGMASLLAAVTGLYRYSPQPQLRVLDYQQITRDGIEKFLAGTDGTWLYMTGGTTAPLSRVSVKGGEIQGISSTKAPVTPYVDWEVSRDGSKVLIQVIENVSQMGLWCASVYGGPPTRVAFGRRLWGSFTPDGQSVLYLTGDDEELHLVGADGKGDRKLATLGTGASEARMSPDGSRIRIIKNGSLWDAFADGSGLHRLFPDWHGPARIYEGRWSFDGSIYVFSESRRGAGPNQIWAVDERQSFLKHRGLPVPLTSGPMFWDRPVPDEHGSEIYTIGMSLKGELSQVDLRSGRLRPYLGGISADHVAFSPDGRRLVYTAFPFAFLWRANSDGSNPVRLTGEPLHAVMNASWSPDGKQILFANGEHATAPKAYLVPAEGGSATELLPGDDETQADPNWSPDGRRIVLTGGNPSTTSQQYLRILDLASHRLTTVPGSQGYWSPRWSPDGKYLAALSGQRGGSLMIFRVKTKSWSAIELPYSASYPTFSRDSKQLYFLMQKGARGGGVYRVPINGGLPKQVFDLGSVPLVILTDQSMSLDPTDTPILTRNVGTCDIYALHLNH